MAALFRYLALKGFPNDQFEHLAGAQQMLMGEWPSWDFTDQGTPLMYVASAGAQWLLGRTLFAEAVLTSVAFGLAAAWTLLAAERVSRSLTVGVIAAAFSVAIFPRAYAYPKVLLLSAGLLVMWAWLRTPSRSRMAWLACIVVVASLFRPDYGLYLGAAGLATVLLAPADGWRHACTRALMFCALVAVLLAPYAVYLEAFGGIQSAVRKVIEYGVWHANRTHLDVGELGWSHEVRLYYAFHALPFVVNVESDSDCYYVYK